MSAVVPELGVARGHWLRRDLIAWPADDLPPGLDPDALDWRLHWSPDDGINPREPEPVRWSTATLLPDPSGIPPEVGAAFPHLRSHLALRVDARTADRVDEVLRGQIAVSVHLHSGRLVTAGGLQIPGVVDQVYARAASATLGISWADGTPTLRLWAPTAIDVRLLLWPPEANLHEAGSPLPMTRDSDGVWEIVGAPGWSGARYKYEVTVYTPHHMRVVSNQVTDPYSVALTVNSTHSVVVDLSDADLAPEEWRHASPPVLEHPVDQVIYELHVRDFSISDKSVPEDLRGSFLAFDCDSAGMYHLRRLAAAGLNTVQLMPVFDNATVEEARERQTRPEKVRLRSLPPDSPEQQRAIRESPVSGFNWGYDPWHYFSSEGSYSSSLETADGRGRVAEFRTMVGALHAAGLRVVLDQVFNHTASSGQDIKSVLDRIVPGYYHRLSPAGVVETSTCCPNVATEHLMAEKLMVDACVSWARHYKVDGFRFDLMGHHSRANMVAVRRALDALTPARDGVDGRLVTLYGEGWNFGEIADNARFIQASQGQLGGTGIATFSDRLRDAVRGGSAFDADPRIQGFGTGLFTADNGSPANGDAFAQRGQLQYATDLVQLGLAGTLRDFQFQSNAHGRVVRGDELDFHGAPAGYADAPDEVISYVDAHDNETLFDALTLKLPVETAMSDRVRMNTLCLALATLSQSPVMWHAGTDMLRSKSLDRNSYNSGDWFNFLDFTMTDNGFAAGLPPEDDNGAKWEYLQPLLANPALKPSPEDIRQAHEQALDVLTLRRWTRLFRLRTARQIREKVSFPVSNTWQQIPGVIVMRINDRVGDPVDHRHVGVAVVFNATPRTVHQGVPGSTSRFTLCPVQALGADDVVREAAAVDGGFRVPARTVAVFAEPR